VSLFHRLFRKLLRLRGPEIDNMAHSVHSSLPFPVQSQCSSMHILIERQGSRNTATAAILSKPKFPALALSHLFTSIFLLPTLSILTNIRPNRWWLVPVALRHYHRRLLFSFITDRHFSYGMHIYLYHWPYLSPCNTHYIPVIVAPTLSVLFLYPNRILKFQFQFLPQAYF
jgi:hypothetical protein